MNARTPLYVFDLDDTLAITTHRQHLLESKAPNRHAIYAAQCHKDRPNHAVVQTFNMLRDSGAEIRILSGRADSARIRTIDWLVEHTNLTHEAIAAMDESWLTLRPDGDRVPDDRFKHRWLAQLSMSDRRRLVAVFEDRDRVVKMWRDAGVTCFQVAPGDF